jgi:hypothetical protein
VGASLGARLRRSRHERLRGTSPGPARRRRRTRGDVILDLTRDEIDALLHEQVVGRVGCHVDGLTYVVPLIYAYDGDAFYIASIEGQKVEMMRRNPNVCFEVDTYGPDGWRSAIVQGVYEELSEQEKPRALELLRERFTRDGVAPSRRPETHGRPTVCFRIAIREITGRARG